MRNFYVLSADAVTRICEREPRFKKVLKGYSGEVVTMDVAEKPMLLPNIPEIIRKVDFMWAMVVFGHNGNTKAEKVIAKEIAKCLEGKVYSVKKLADTAAEL